MGQRIIQGVPGNVVAQEIPLAERRVHWRDIIELDVRDPTLRTRIEGVLDYLEKTKVGYTLNDPKGALLGMGQLSGQDMFRQISLLKNRYESDGTMASVQKQNYMPHGKFVIRQDDTPYDGTEKTRPVTGVLRGTNNPVVINMPTDYLKGARLRNADGTTHPLTIDQSVIHELTHVALQTGNEAQPLANATLFIRAMGGDAQGTLIFKKNSNVTPSNPSGYETLYDKISAAPKRIGILNEFDQNRSDMTPVALIADTTLGSPVVTTAMKF